jgi:hypothetical protein
MRYKRKEMMKNKGLRMRNLKDQLVLQKFKDLEEEEVGHQKQTLELILEKADSFDIYLITKYI